MKALETFLNVLMLKINKEKTIFEIEKLTIGMKFDSIYK